KWTGFRTGMRKDTSPSTCGSQMERTSQSSVAPQSSQTSLISQTLRRATPQSFASITAGATIDSHGLGMPDVCDCGTKRFKNGILDESRERHPKAASARQRPAVV